MARLRFRFDVTARAAQAAALACLLFGLAPHGARAQMPMPTLPKPSGADLFRQQCAACHTTNASDPQRQVTSPH